MERRAKFDPVVQAAFVAGIFGVLAIIITQLIEIDSEPNKTAFEVIKETDKQICFSSISEIPEYGGNVHLVCLDNKNSYEYHRLFSNSSNESPATLCSVHGIYEIDSKFLRLKKGKSGKCDNGRSASTHGDILCIEEVNYLRCVTSKGDFSLFKTQQSTQY